MTDTFKSIDAMIAELRELRTAHERHGQAAQSALEEFKRTDDTYTFNHDTEIALGQQVKELEYAIRVEALRIHQATGEKKINDHVTVKTFKTFEITDPAVMEHWVRTSLPDALKIDEAKVKNYAMKVGPVEGTRTGEEHRAQIATNLGDG